MSGRDAAALDDDREVLLRNEFAMVGVRLVVDRDVAVLRIRNVETDESIDLDPLELESLTRLRHRDLGAFIVYDDVDPTDR